MSTLILSFIAFTNVRLELFLSCILSPLVFQVEITLLCSLKDKANFWYSVWKSTASEYVAFSTGPR